MPLSARSVRRFLVPVILGLSPLAASAASDVTILRDEWGIPQVYADDVYGLYAGFGYAVAEDRLFQMEMARRSVLGTVSCGLRAIVSGSEGFPASNLERGRMPATNNREQAWRRLWRISPWRNCRRATGEARTPRWRGTTR